MKRDRAAPEAAAVVAGSPAADAAGSPPAAAAGTPAAAVIGTPPAEPAGHPGPVRAVLPAVIRDAMVAHARAEYPNEACGLIAGTSPAAEGGVAVAWHPTRNRAASPLRYEIHPGDLLRVSLAIDDADQVIWGIVHSHVRSPARPSATDVGLAFYPDALYLLVSLSEAETDPATGAESVRAWRILDGAAFEVELAIENVEPAIEAPGEAARLSAADEATEPPGAARAGAVPRAAEPAKPAEPAAAAEALGATAAAEPAEPAEPGAHR